jgi:hypothetical protein
VTGVPGAYYLWYRRVYNACKSDSAIMFAWFFLIFSAHILFCVYAAIAPSSLFGRAVQVASIKIRVESTPAFSA